MAFPIPEDPPVIKTTFGINVGKGQRCGYALTFPNKGGNLTNIDPSF